MSNIMHTIATVPKLYVQVLHLMNKMNLPPPFGPVTAVPPLLLPPMPISQPSPLPPRTPSVKRKRHDDLLASDESELESSDEDNGPSQLYKKQRQSGKPSSAAKFVPVANHMVKLGTPARREVDLNTPSKKITPSTSCSDNAARGPLSLITSTLPPLSAAPQLSEGNVESVERLSVDAEDGSYIPLEDVQKNRMPTEDIVKIGSFKSYTPGNPSTTLYIKNLSHKKVTEGQLLGLFGRYGVKMYRGRGCLTRFTFQLADRDIKMTVRTSG
ncbi:hypothetical protein HK104_010429 [Borealophlyctis nickersoniae]|nr:hypothetical protein HK104_010429 [Borealophlyctis nickersoniae]